MDNLIELNGLKNNPRMAKISLVTFPTITRSALNIQRKDPVTKEMGTIYCVPDEYDDNIFAFIPNFSSMTKLSCGRLSHIFFLVSMLCRVWVISIGNKSCVPLPSSISHPSDRHQLQ